MRMSFASDPERETRVALNQDCGATPSALKMRWVSTGVF